MFMKMPAEFLRDVVAGKSPVTEAKAPIITGGTPMIGVDAQKLRMEIDLNFYSCVMQRIVSSQPCAMFPYARCYKSNFSPLFGLPISLRVEIPDPQGHIILCGR